MHTYYTIALLLCVTKQCYSAHPWLTFQTYELSAINPKGEAPLIKHRIDRKQVEPITGKTFNQLVEHAHKREGLPYVFAPYIRSDKQELAVEYLDLIELLKIYHDGNVELSFEPAFRDAVRNAISAYEKKQGRNPNIHWMHLMCVYPSKSDHAPVCVNAFGITQNRTLKLSDARCCTAILLNHEYTLAQKLGHVCAVTPDGSNATQNSLKQFWKSYCKQVASKMEG